MGHRTGNGPPDAVRLALVMNGGVSLAVWMGGVTHEIDRLRRSGPTEVDAASPAWRALCTAARRSVVIDLVAGTSAGGLNGALLATAIARGAPLPSLQGLWREEARLVRQRLLHPTTPQPTTSVLDGDFLLRTIGDRLEAVEPKGPRQDVTLLVTASALYGSSTAVVDASDQRFTAGDHRRVYRFRRRAAAMRLSPGGAFVDARLDDFETAPDELRLAARASGGFPFAFGPVAESAGLHALDVSGSQGEPGWLVDGGVLDNAPFRPLLKELRDQPVAEPGPRWIVYVVPSQQAAPPVLPSMPVSAKAGANPPRWTSLPGRIWALSRESDLRDDVTALGELWRAGQVRAHPPEALIGSGHRGIGLVAAAEALFPAYRRTKLAAMAGELLLEDATPTLTDRHVSERHLEQLMKLDVCLIPDEPWEPQREMGPSREPSWQWGIGAARRIARWISRDARGAAADRPLSHEVRQEIARVEERLLALEDALPAHEDRAVRERAALVGSVQALHEATLASRRLPLVLEEMRTVVGIWAMGRNLGIEAAWQRVLSAEIVTNALAWDQPGQPPGFAFHLLSPDSRHEGTVLGLGVEADPRVSPHWPDNKLYGTRFGHFGAFGARRYRDWDWMWGRLDGALTLGRALLAGTLAESDEQRRLVDDLLGEILAESGVKPGDVQRLTAEVCGLTPGKIVAQARELGETDFDGVIDDIAALLANNDVLTKRTGAGALRRVNARVRGWAVRRAIGFAAQRAKRLVAKQQA